MNSKVLFRLAAILLCATMNGQSVTDVGIAVTATVQTFPDQITLQWPSSSTATQHQVYRMDKGQMNWGLPLATLPGFANQFTDPTALAGMNYEYRVVRTGPSYTGYGYINSGIKVPAIEFRGKLLLIVDSTMIVPLTSELDRLVNDIEGDGWEVKRIDVDRGGSVNHVKDLIVNEQLIDTNVRAIFFVGHVPVAYSGNIAPDGHSDHVGAWPADCFYGDIDGQWTDYLITSPSASPLRTQNVPNDGKFDQSTVPGAVELQVGRVDFANLPAFADSETQLLKAYLDKDHEYRKKIYQPIKRAVIDDNFGYFGGEAFAASAYKNFGPLVSTSSITAGDYFTSMSSASYQWSYGCGGGSYTSAGGIGSTSSFAASTLQGVFTMLFGSYFGDWDSQNNFLRAALAQGKMLCNVWSGRPHFQFHHMGLGENIGYSIKATQNLSGSLYFASTIGIYGGYVHNALMGDPTLRNDIVAPAAHLVANKQGFDCLLTWTASSDTAVSGYHIYRKSPLQPAYVRLNGTPVVSTTYTDLCLPAGSYTYMVRALMLETTPSGSYYNLSEGIIDTAMTPGYNVAAQFSTTVSGNTVTLQNLSVNAINYSWSASQATSTLTAPGFTFSANGTYTLKLLASNSCDNDSISKTVTICHWFPSGQFTANVVGDTVYFTSSTNNASSVKWDFGNGMSSALNNPVIRYSYPGTYPVKMYITNICGIDSFQMLVRIIDVGVKEQMKSESVLFYPNPATDKLFVKGFKGKYQIISVAGTVVKEGLVEENGIDIEMLAKGIYILKLENELSIYNRKVVLK